MTDLIDRYVAAVLRAIPEDRRSDVDDELRAGIADAIEPLIEAGEGSESAERAVLTDLGDPARLAADYSDRPLWLIGPNYYLAWLQTMKRLAMLIPPIVGVVVGAIDFALGASLVTALWNGLGAAFIAAVNVVFWVTVGFVIAERSESVASEDVAPFTKWTVDRLATAKTLDRQFSLAETIGAVVFQLVIILVLVAQGRLRALPYFDPDTWSRAIAVILGLVVVSTVLQIVKYRVGRWTMGLATVNAALNLGFAIWWVWALNSGGLLNVEYFDELDLGDWVSPAARITTLVIVAICTWDTVEAFIKARRSGRV